MALLTRSLARSLLSFKPQNKALREPCGPVGNLGNFFSVLGENILESKMAPLLFFTCPTTHRRAPTRVEIDPKSLAAAWKRTLKVQCPHCGEMHQVTVRDAYIAFAIQDGTDPIVVDRPPGIAPQPPKGFPREEPARERAKMQAARRRPKIRQYRIVRIC